MSESYSQNPFPKPLESTYQLIVRDVDRIAMLNPSGLLVLANAFTKDKFDKENKKIVLNVKDIAVAIYQNCDETIATRIRRGIKNLVHNAIIAQSDERDTYWINPGVIWK